MSSSLAASVIAVLVAALLAVAVGYLLLARRATGLPEVTASFGETRIRAEVANSALSRARGLGYRDSLPDGRGMLFSFGEARRYSFWMQGMRFPIDIVWLRDGAVVDVTADVQPQPGASMLSLAKYAPQVPADEVLELPAGYAAAHGIAAGSRMVVTQD